jgi:hypothetical protein
MRMKRSRRDLAIPPLNVCATRSYDVVLCLKLVPSSRSRNGRRRRVVKLTLHSTPPPPSPLSRLAHQIVSRKEHRNKCVTLKQKLEYISLTTLETMSTSKSKYIISQLPVHLKKKAKVARDYKKVVTPQKLSAIVKSKSLKNSCESLNVSLATAKRIRAAAKSGKLSASSLKRLRDRCINESIRLLQFQNQKALAHNVNAKDVKAHFEKAVKKSKQFAPLRGKKTPCDQVFRTFIKLHKKASPTGRVEYRKRHMENKPITETQYRARVNHGNAHGY